MSKVTPRTEWTCPYCQQERTLGSEHVINGRTDLMQSNALGPRRFATQFVICPNPKCKKFTLTGSLIRLLERTGAAAEEMGTDQTWRLIPCSDAKVFPDYIPAALRVDYQEACAVKNLSPKASASLSRRCLQGMIRDFWKISKPRLIDEIDAIKDKVDSLTWQAIDAVRSVGNIGAHMEKDINVIIDVDPDEAAQLIGLIELLIRDWYITRHEREERLKGIAELASAKKAAKTP